MKEKKVETYLARGVEAMGGICYKFSSPNRRFVPDRIAVLPHGLVWFIECKRPKGRVHAGQVREQVRLLDLGQRVEIVSSLEQVDTLLDTMAMAVRVASITTGDIDAL